MEQDSAKDIVPQQRLPKVGTPTSKPWSSGRDLSRVVRVQRRVFQRLLPERPTPERCVEAYYRRTRFEGIAKRKLRGHC